MNVLHGNYNISPLFLLRLSTAKAQWKCKSFSNGLHMDTQLSSLHQHDSLKALSPLCLHSILCTSTRPWL